MKKKGFTLIELLAVIVVIAIIAIIATPLILGVIKNAEKEGYKDSIYGIMESARIYLASNIDKIDETEEIEFVCNGESCKRTNGDSLDFKGRVPKSGSIYLKGNEILIESVYNGKYYANNETGEVVITEEDTTLTRGELTQLVKELQNRVELLENQKADKTTVSTLQSQHTSDTSNLQNQINVLDGKTINIDEIYPIGSIYTTTSNVNPSTLFKGTTWERYGVGRTLLSTDGTSGETGGSSTISLKTANLPSHSHSIPSLSGSAASNGAHTHTLTPSGTVTSTFTGTKGTTSSNGAHTHNIHIGGYALSTGTSGPGLVGTSANSATLQGSASSGAHTHTLTPSGTVSSKFTGTKGTTSSNGAHTHTVSTTESTSGNTGSGSSINVMNPYITVYMWKRVS